MLAVWVAPGDGATVRVALGPGTSTPGLHAPDCFHTWARLGTAARFGTHGWQDLLLPYENFHIVGIPEGWRRVETLEVEVSGHAGRVYLGAIQGQRRRRAVGPRLTREGLFDEKDLAEAGYDSLHLRVGDGYGGWPEAAPFDAVLLTAAPREIPEPLLDQLAEGGLLIAPVGGWHQELVQIRKMDGEL